jgi:hypothetical protein
MADKKITLDSDGFSDYFKNLSMDLWIAYAIIAVGLVAIVLGFVL